MPQGAGESSDYIKLADCLYSSNLNSLENTVYKKENPPLLGEILRNKLYQEKFSIRFLVPMDLR